MFVPNTRAAKTQQKKLIELKEKQIHNYTWSLQYEFIEKVDKINKDVEKLNSTIS